MSQFFNRMQTATARMMAFFGTVQFKWKNAGPEIPGLLGEQDTTVSDKKRLRKNSITVLKSAMPDVPVVGRELTIVATGDRWEVESFQDDEITWDIRLTQPKSP